MTDEQFNTIMSRLDSIEIKVEQVDRRVDAIAIAVEDCTRYTEWKTFSAEWQAEPYISAAAVALSSSSVKAPCVRFVDGLPVPKDSSTSSEG